ncbi:LysR family transcriptional regulator [Ancylobacter radicis]|uniref:LysR family transcriptional regulator n=1 Tax=Ancylobacter radicis TaxID=2836179 RepID=A0ABS5R6X4_9HYPH|nr:LysR family transcriptional regulator [Ancylobacter radicis]MBS9477005.1 LysR family transcriptional regulator [Ancylobacter radicis]
MLDLAAVTLLVELASAGSLAGAARRLHLSPMAASRLLAKLEQELGVRLVQRTTRSLSFTDDGLAFLPHAQALVEDHAAALASLHGRSGEPSGLLRMSASLAFGRKVMAPLIVDFMQAHPRIEVELQLTDAVVDIVAEGLDLGIRIADLADTSLIARKLADSPRRLVAAPAYAGRFGVPERLDALADHVCLTSSLAPHWLFRTASGRRRVSVRGRFSANSLDAVQEACVGGLGIANLSDWHIREELAAGRLREIVLADATPEPLTIWAVYPTRRMVPSKVRLFIDALAARLAGPS